MAAIECGIISLTNVVRGDMLDVSIGVEHDLDLTGKTLYAEVRRNDDAPVLLKFMELDSSLVKTVSSAQLMTIKFYKPASAMNIPDGNYQIAVVMGTSPGYEDKQTIIRGTVSVISEITHKPTA